MPALPNISGRQAVIVFGKDGWQLARQRGSHMVLVKPGHIASLSIPITRNWPKERCAP